MADLEARLRAVEERNARVTYDKAWETSWLRRGLIAGVTYACGFVLLNILGHEDAWKHALVPVMGYLLSTFSLPPIKKMWLKRETEKREGLKNVTIH
jgi:hypothetical protein